jgi:hypothetical protein
LCPHPTLALITLCRHKVNTCFPQVGTRVVSHVTGKHLPRFKSLLLITLLMLLSRRQVWKTNDSRRNLARKWTMTWSSVACASSRAVVATSLFHLPAVQLRRKVSFGVSCTLAPLHYRISVLNASLRFPPLQS